MRTRLVLLLVTAVLVTASASYATTVTEIPWGPTDWPCINEIPTMTKEFDWSWGWQVTPDGFTEPAHVVEFYGAAPALDPDISETIRNRSSVAWTDWEVQITNGTYVPGSAVVKNLSAQSPLWEIDITPNGFTAHVISGQGTEVLGRPISQQLSVFFSYEVSDPLQQVSISEFPTSYYPIPEPATIMTLLAGCLGFGLRRRKA